MNLNLVMLFWSLTIDGAAKKNKLLIFIVLIGRLLLIIYNQTILYKYVIYKLFAISISSYYINYNLTKCYIVDIFQYYHETLNTLYEFQHIRVSLHICRQEMPNIIDNLKITI